MDEVKRITDEEAKAAGVRVEKRVRERTAEIAATVLTRMNMQRFGTELRISVNFDNTAE